MNFVHDRGYCRPPVVIYTPLGGYYTMGRICPQLARSYGMAVAASAVRDHSERVHSGDA